MITVTVGIPAYNEGKNITFLLDSILMQIHKSYILEKIIVVSDGSVDDTEEKVNQMIEKNPLIELMAEGIRIGKSRRLMNLYQKNQSDIFIQLDGDTVLANNMVIEEMVKPFWDNNVAIVSGDRIPLSDNTFVAKIFLNRNLLWRQIRTSLTNPNVMNNCFGCILALRKNFSKSLILKPKITSESPVIYFEAIKSKSKFRFAPKAGTYYKIASGLKDNILQMGRSSDETDELINQYGPWVADLGKIPQSLKLHVLATFLFKDPMYTILSTIVCFVLQHFPYNPKVFKNNGLWKEVSSTKSGISQVNN